MASARFQVVSLPRPATDSVAAARESGRIREKARPAETVVLSRRFTWRFLAANNRSLATATTIFPDASSCIAAMHELKRGLAVADCEFARGDDGLWRWTVTVDGAGAASSSSYRRQVRARLTCENFFVLAGSPAALDNIQVVYR